MILKNTIKNASLLLKNSFIKSHLLDAEIIISNIMNVKREFLLLNDDMMISKSIINIFPSNGASSSIEFLFLPDLFLKLNITLVKIPKLEADDIISIFSKEYLLRKMKNRV